MTPNQDIFILDKEQPACCPLCGARTKFEEIINGDKGFQKHPCLNPECLFRFMGEFESEEA